MTARAARLSMALILTAGVAGCGWLGGGGQTSGAPQDPDIRKARESGTIWDLFSNSEDPNYTVAVNKYLWNASLEVLNFLPIQSVDPYTGIIQTGAGTPPGGGRAYRATIKISDPALDARSLKLSMQYAGGGAVPVDTVRAVEDAILTRARQLRIRDGGL